MFAPTNIHLFKLEQRGNFKTHENPVEEANHSKQLHKRPDLVKKTDEMAFDHRNTFQ